MLSVIVVTYNSAEQIELCLDSLRSALAHWGGQGEILVVDNASSDDTGRLVGRDQDVRLLRQPFNLGFAAGVNAGLRECRGELVLLINPDCFFEHGLGSMVRFLETHPNVAVVGPRIIDESGTSRFYSGRFPSLVNQFAQHFGLLRLFPRSSFLARHLYRDWDHGADRRVDWLTGACLLLRMSAIAEVGPMDEDYFLYAEEVDLQWRLAKAGYETWYLTEPRVRHLGGRSARSHRATGMLDGILVAEFAESLTLFFRKQRGPAQAWIHRRM
ncbi:MAG TPA: glycosyltransferase family 2 protein, partial [Candidatus Eisenbacteria bacterium]|nr:glycosyltransferase family 2 protein [Candidatus Eisenbacteria bacterium]